MSCGSYFQGSGSDTALIANPIVNSGFSSGGGAVGPVRQTAPIQTVEEVFFQKEFY